MSSKKTNQRSRNSRRASQHRKTLVELLEQKQLLDAYGLAAFDAPDSTVETRHAGVLQPQSTLQLDTDSVNAAASNLVFVDSGIEANLQLPDNLPHNTQVISLRADQDGLRQIANHLQGRSGITTIHIFSHGASGQLQLGSANITTDQLAQRYASTLQQIGSALAAEADILFYGCDLAAGQDGKAFTNTFAKLTGADVAASVDATGNLEFGGDWKLEYVAGNVESNALRATALQGTLAIEATDGLLTIQDAENSGAGTITLTNNGASQTVTSAGTPFRVAQMLQRIWQFNETADTGRATFVADISGVSGIGGTIASDFGLIISDQPDLSGANTTTLVASGMDNANGLLYFHQLDLDDGAYVGLATRVVPDFFSISPAGVTQEDTPIDLELALRPAITTGGAFRDIIGTATGYRPSSDINATTSYLIPAGTTGIKVTGYATRDTDTIENDEWNDDYQVLNASIDLLTETSNGSVAYIATQGPTGSDLFSWSNAPLGAPILTGGGTITGDSNNGIQPTFTVTNGELQILEDQHPLQTAYHVEFLTNATSSANFLQTSSDFKLAGDLTDAVIATPANADFAIININDAAAGENYRIEYKGNSRILLDYSTLTSSGVVAAVRGETDNRVINYAFEQYDVSSAAIGTIIDTATVTVGDTASNVDTYNDNQIYIDGSGNLVIHRDGGFAAAFNSMVTVEFYERVDVGSSAAKLGDSADYQLLQSGDSGSAETQYTSFDVPEDASIGILNMALNGTGINTVNENSGLAFAVINLDSQTTSGSWYMQRGDSIVDLVGWNDVDFGTRFFDSASAVSNHTAVSQFVDQWPATAEINLINGGQTLQLSTISTAGNDGYLSYYTSGQIEWFGTTALEVSGFPEGGGFSAGSIDPDTGEWNATVEELLATSFTFTPTEHLSSSSGATSLSLDINGDVKTTSVLVQAVIDTVSFTPVDATGNEDAAVDISANVVPIFVDDDGSETVTSLVLSAITVGHALTDGTNSFTASAGNQTLDITGWDRDAITYEALPNEFGTFPVNIAISWQDVGEESPKMRPTPRLSMSSSIPSTTVPLRSTTTIPSSATPHSTWPRPDY